MDQNITASPPAAPAEAAPPASPPVAPQPRWTSGLITIAALIAVLAFLLGCFRPTNSDLWLSLAAGKLLAAGDYHFGVDPFSWASEGAYWANQSWLSSLFGYLIYVQLGPSALLVVKALLIVALAGFLLAARFKSSPLLPALELTALAIVVASPRFLMQSTLLSFVCLGILLWLLTRDGYLGGVTAKAKALWQIPLLFLLWSNLDGYFILGLLVVGLVAAGLTVFRESRADAKRLALIFVLSIAACVLNPHLFANFTLPADLAIMFNGVLPSSMTAAGQTLDVLSKGDTGLLPVSPFSSYGVSGLNWNVAGYMFYLLVLLNVVSFAFVLGDKALFARGLVCLALGVLAAFQIRLVPFYAIAAAPLSLQNFTEFVQKSRRGRPASSSGFPRFAAFTTGVFLCFAIFLAWPGWLHQHLAQFHDDALFQSSRRVVFDFAPDPSLEAAARKLDEEAREGRIHNIFNPAPDIAHYCAYFAPAAKCGVDSRYALFAGKAKAYAELRNDLLDNFAQRLQKKDAKDDATIPWPKLMAEMNVDTVAVSAALNPNSKSSLLADRMLLTPMRWKSIVADGQTFAGVFSGESTWPTNELLARADRQAFAPHPEADWLPGNKAMEVPRELVWIEQYFFGHGQIPLETTTANFDYRSHQNYSRLWIEPYFAAYQSLHILPAVGNVGGGIALAQQAAVDSVFGERIFARPLGNDHTWFHSIDFGPPSLPILAKRNLRRSIDKNPNVAVTYELLAQVSRQTLVQESWWSRHRLEMLRQQLRRIEMMTAIRNAVTLAPHNLQYRFQLATALADQNYFDAAVAEYGEAMKILEDAPVSAASLLKYYPAEYEQLKRLELTKGFEPGKYIERYNQIRATVKRQAENQNMMLKRRLDDLELRAAEARTGAPPEWDRFRLAAQLPWRYTDQENKPREEPGRGLPLEGIKALEKANTASWPDDLKRARYFELIRLYCAQGKIREAVDSFAEGTKEVGNLPIDCSVWVFAATGWYDKLDEAFAALEKALENGLAQHMQADQAGIVRGFGLNQLVDEPTAARIFHGWFVQRWILIQSQIVMEQTSVLCDLRTLRGLYALERGDTARALGYFEQAIAANVPFHDQPIATRYRDLLKQQGNR